MGEKETAAASDQMKQAPDKKKDAERESLEGNSANPEAAERKHDTVKNAIQNMR